MPKYNLIMPKMGESIMEATIIKWTKSIGDFIAIDEIVLEVATDKVDSEIPSPYEGFLTEILYQSNDVVPIGQPIAIISSSKDDEIKHEQESKIENEKSDEKTSIIPEHSELESTKNFGVLVHSEQKISIGGNKFFSPLVKNIAKEENVSDEELFSIIGTGLDGRVTKIDLLDYIKTRKQPSSSKNKTIEDKNESQATLSVEKNSNLVEIVEMDRMRKLIADHMVMSKHTSPHVTSFVEVDMTRIVKWREKNKVEFEKKNGTKLTYTPFFIEAVVKAIKDFPNINASVNDNKIFIKKTINIGMAAALPGGNLIVPVIKNADSMNLIGLSKMVNDLATRARENRLKPDEIQDGTFTVTNVGTFGNLMGTPIINQPQVAILATGIITKRPVVIESDQGDTIGIRNMMYLSLSYDHRVVDGYLGGSFLKRVGDYLEAFQGE